MAADPLTSRTADELLRDHAAFDTDDEDLAEREPLNAQRDDKAVLSPRKRKLQDAFQDDKIEEEVKITKQRKRIPKLDTDRLISEAGIPKIRNLIRTDQLKRKLRLKGKGHEFSDAARLLNYYQIWLDNLYPRAKFSDAVQMVEKAGHTKKMQMYRKSWIDEGKPGYVRKEDMVTALDTREELVEERLPEPNGSKPSDSAATFDEDPDLLFFGGDAGAEAVDSDHDGPDDDELEALLAQEQEPQASRTVPKAAAVEDDSEGEDDLDALLAQTHHSGPAFNPRLVRENNQGTSSVAKDVDQEHTQHTRKRSELELEEDDLEDLLNEQLQSATTDANTKQILGRNEILYEDTDDLDELLNTCETAKEPELPINDSNKILGKTSATGVPSSEAVPELDNIISSSPIPNIRTDELDQLMDEHDAAIAQQQKKVDPEIVEEFLSSSPIQN